MAKYNFYQDQKLIQWKRFSFSIEAETEEEARKIATNVVGFNDVYDIEAESGSAVQINNTEDFLDSAVILPIIDNAGFSTIETYATDGELLASNGK